MATAGYLEVGLCGGHGRGPEWPFAGPFGEAGLGPSACPSGRCSLAGRPLRRGHGSPWAGAHGDSPAAHLEQTRGQRLAGVPRSLLLLLRVSAAKLGVGSGRARPGRLEACECGNDGARRACRARPTTLRVTLVSAPQSSRGASRTRRPRLLYSRQRRARGRGLGEETGVSIHGAPVRCARPRRRTLGPGTSGAYGMRQARAGSLLRTRHAARGTPSGGPPRWTRSGGHDGHVHAAAAASVRVRTILH